MAALPQSSPLPTDATPAMELTAAHSDAQTSSATQQVTALPFISQLIIPAVMDAAHQQIASSIQYRKYMLMLAEGMIFRAKNGFENPSAEGAGIVAHEAKRAVEELGFVLHHVLRSVEEVLSREAYKAPVKKELHWTTLNEQYVVQQLRRSFAAQQIRSFAAQQIRSFERAAGSLADAVEQLSPAPEPTPAPKPTKEEVAWKKSQDEKANAKSKAEMYDAETLLRVEQQIRVAQYQVATIAAQFSAKDKDMPNLLIAQALATMHSIFKAEDEAWKAQIQIGDDSSDNRGALMLCFPTYCAIYSRLKGCSIAAMEFLRRDPIGMEAQPASNYSGNSVDWLIDDRLPAHFPSLPKEEQWKLLKEMPLIETQTILGPADDYALSQGHIVAQGNVPYSADEIWKLDSIKQFLAEHDAIPSNLRKDWASLADDEVHCSTMHRFRSQQTKLNSNYCVQELSSNSKGYSGQEGVARGETCTFRIVAVITMPVDFSHCKEVPGELKNRFATCRLGEKRWPLDTHWLKIVWQGEAFENLPERPATRCDSLTAVCKGNSGPTVRTESEIRAGSYQRYIVAYPNAPTDESSLRCEFVVPFEPFKSFCSDRARHKEAKRFQSFVIGTAEADTKVDAFGTHASPFLHLADSQMGALSKPKKEDQPQQLSLKPIILKAIFAAPMFGLVWQSIYQRFNAASKGKIANSNKRRGGAMKNVQLGEYYNATFHEPWGLHHMPTSARD